jgi:transposase
MLPDPPQPETLEEARALARLLWVELLAVRSELEGLQTRVQELEARLGQHSSNSSRPPSSDPPAAPPRPPTVPTGRQRGGQPGHPPHQRARIPLEQVDQIVVHWPTHCRRCQAPLPPSAAREPVRHQVTELPPVRAVVTEHQLQQVCCAACQTTTCAVLPADVPPGAFGPRLQATVAVLSGRYRLSRREVVGVCTDVLGAPLAVGSVDALCQATAAALAAPLDELERALPQQAAVHADETSWREAGQRGWLWVTVAALFTVFRIDRHRSSAVIQGLLHADFGGKLITDRWSAYTWLPLEQRQLCWAHLKRDFQKLVDLGGTARPIGEDGLRLLADLFDAWHAGRAEPAPRPLLAHTVQPVQDAFRALLERGQACGHYKAIGLCETLLKQWPALWTFLTVDGVEPTNNRAEQALRPAVLWRKGSFGTRCAAGSRFVARLLSVAATCKQQDRSLLAYLTAVCAAAQAGHLIPSLLPRQPSSLPVLSPTQAA